MHPFCTGAGSDVRLTTRFARDNVLDALGSTMHEAGHAMYEQGVDPGLEVPQVVVADPDHGLVLAEDFSDEGVGLLRQHERRLQRNKAIVTAVFAVLLLFWVLYQLLG